jgi:hypothetical protein
VSWNLQYHRFAEGEKMDAHCLKEKDQYPDDDVLSRCLGERKKSWDAFIDFIKKNHSAFTTEWRYYNDGKAWLFKITKKAKTICWVSVYHNLFKTTFYFNDRAEESVIKSGLKKEFKDQFTEGKKYGKIRGITVEIQRPSDLDTVKILIGIKEKIK